MAGSKAGAKKSFEILKDTINNGSFQEPDAVVNKAIADVEKSFETDIWDDADWGDIEEVFTTINSSVKVFTSSDSNPYDYAVAALHIASAMVKAIPVAGAITGPIVFVLNLTGSIMSHYGSEKYSKESRYYSAVETIVNTAISKSNADTLNRTLAVDLSAVYKLSTRVYNLLTNEAIYTDPKTELANQGLTVKDFSDIADSSVNTARLYIDDMIPGMDKPLTNGANVAEMFYRTSELVQAKAICYLAGVCYFAVLECYGKDAKAQSTSGGTLVTEFRKFIKDSHKWAEPYFCKPTLRGAAITLWIYNIDKDPSNPNEVQKFRFIAFIYKCLILAGGGEYTVWPDDAPLMGFSCREPQSHNAYKDNPAWCVRLTTLFAYNKDKYLTLPSDDHSYTTEKTTAVLQPSFKTREKEMKQKVYYKDIPADTDRSHFWGLIELYKYPGIKPYYRWSLHSRNFHHEVHKSGILGGMNYDFGSDFDCYFFEVFPTEAEVENRNKSIWPNDWQCKPDYVGMPEKDKNKSMPQENKRYLIMGVPTGDDVYCDHDAEEWQKKPYTEVVYDSKHFGCPDHCIWVCLDDTQLLGDQVPAAYK